ncbi:MAG: heme-binding domain-containing protein [Bacteroidetes bacterium]|nr:heme-binding domain-containing protein [Bacteroidota bacterium]
MKNKTLLIVGSLALILLVISFFDDTDNRGEWYGPNDFTHRITADAPVKAILEKACFDCHSNKTNYRWYNDIPPVSLLLNNHVNEGKKELNFSEFATYTAKRAKHKLEEIGEQIENGEMPMKPYLLTHEEAKLSDEEKALLITWSKNAMAEIH